MPFPYIIFQYKKAYVANYCGNKTANINVVFYIFLHFLHSTAVYIHVNGDLQRLSSTLTLWAMWWWLISPFY